MEEYAKSLIKRVVIAAVLAVAATAMLIGCGSSRSVGVSFTLDEINIYVGETREIAHYVAFTPALSDDRDFTLEASGDCVTVDGTKVVGISAGECTITATTNGAASATAKLKVGYRQPTRIQISTEGALQNVSSLADAKPVSFSAVLDDYVDPNCTVAWYVNGEKVDEGKTFELSPSYLGEYLITAVAGDASAEQSVKIYRKTDAHGEYGGELKQSGNYTPVKFTAREAIDSRNPRSTVEWFVNGEKLCEKPSFNFVPKQAGSYAVELFVNGVKRKIAGEDAVTVSAGERAPSGKVQFDADGVFLVWTDNAHAANVSITAPDGKRTVYYKSDVLTAARFYEGKFDATDLIEVCSDTPSEYKISIAGGEAFTFTQYPSSAAKFITERVLCDNSFIDGAAKAAAWLDELYARGADGTGYLSHEADEVEVKAAISARAKLLGAEVKTSITDNIVNVSLSNYVNVPYAEEQSETEQVRGALPHIEYDQSKIRSYKSYVLACDRRNAEIEVASSEQLWRVAVSKFKPKLTQNSSASSIYARARAALIAIIGTDYNDYKKAHAIHDFLQWTTVKSGAVDKSSSADYIESVFGGAVNSSGVASSAGLAKSFALMCGMEGIDCTVEMETVGGKPYCYNKVKIDGLWYVVDVYGGEGYYSDGTPPKKYEMLSHSRLFITDEKARELGLNPSGVEAFDECSTYLTKRVRGGVYFDYFADKNEITDEKTVYAAVAHVFESAVLGDVTMFTVRGTLSFPNNDVDIEFALDDRLTQTEKNAFLLLVHDTIQKYCKDSSITISENGIQHLSDGRVLRIVTKITNK